MTELYLVRHAQTEGNKNKVFQGQIDCPLSDIGLQQLDLLAERFKNISFDALYSSPLTRAEKTAEAVNRYHDAEIQICPDIIEINGGDFDGTAFADIIKQSPEEADNFSNRPWLFKAPNGETMAEVYQRVGHGISAILAAQRGKRVVVVTHGCAMQNCLAWLLRGKIDDREGLPIVYNTAICHIRITKHGLPFVVSLNDASHLTEDMLKQGKWQLKA